MAAEKLTREDCLYLLIKKEKELKDSVDLAALIDQLQKNPELAITPASLLANGSNSSC